MILMTGWRRDVRDMFLLLDELVAPGTSVHMLAEVPLYERDSLLEEGGLAPSMLTNIHIVHHWGACVIIVTKAMSIIGYCLQICFKKSNNNRRLLLLQVARRAARRSRTCRCTSSTR
jgi:hypothetical protein